MPGSKRFLSNEEVKKLQDIAFEDGVMCKHTPESIDKNAYFLEKEKDEALK